MNIHYTENLRNYSLYSIRSEQREGVLNANRRCKRAKEGFLSIKRIKSKTSQRKVRNDGEWEEGALEVIGTPLWRERNLPSRTFRARLMMESQPLSDGLSLYQSLEMNHLFFQLGSAFAQWLSL
jgi:hypothetical protein